MGIDRETLLAAIRECVTVVGPDEVLAVRGTGPLDDAEIDAIFRQTAAAGVHVLIFEDAEEFAKIKAAEVAVQ